MNERIHKLVGNTMKFCCNCEHFKYPPVENVSPRLCASPKNGIDVVYGKPIMITASTARMHSHLCGHEAKWFEQKKPFWKFWSN